MKKIGLLLFWVLGASAQIPDAVKNQVELRIKHQYNPSIALGVYEDGHQSFFVKGWQNQQKQIPATEQTVYEIGSITKTFTGLLLAILAEEGKVQLDDPVELHWQQPFKLMDARGQAITLKQLSTHTSGLPRIPYNLPAFGNDPNADYGRDDLLAALRNIKPEEAGINHAYSNLAVGLLGETLANAGGQTYNQLIEQKIIQPLSLESTFMTLEDVPEQHLAVGYAGNRTASAWNFKALAGAGSIRSSISDLLAYGVAHINQPEQLENAMALATDTHFQKDKLRVGLGWHFNGDMMWHNGGTGGFRSMLVIDPKNKKVVAAITNNNQHDVEDIAMHLMNAEQVMREHDFPVEIAATELVEFAGDFKQANGDLQITMKISNDRLFFSAPKQPRQAMIYVGQDRFKFKMIDVKVNFIRDEKGEIQSLELHGWGDPQTYHKIN